ncbi:MAG: hypothetical protein PHX64_03565 [Candidatus Omnitrophica bacterium]|nr:hypothetical protein [Candidatus Omnitrophota bacterium]MDD5310811.1 hypothetical protein [Candidatus Omnitrophota bacterium]MDD5546804.1 hypothetical protein [Candidatus Omnitrophota bacterium]
MSIRDGRGLTLIEVVFNMALVSVLMCAIALTYMVGLRVLGEEMTRGGFIKDISYGLNTMSCDLRQATSFIAPTDTRSLTFLADVDGDGSQETIRYRLSRGNLLRTQDGAGAPVVARNVQSLAFRYYRPDDNTNPMRVIVPSQIRVVEIDLTFASGAESIQFTAKVRPRGI